MHDNVVVSVSSCSIMPTSPVKTRIPLTSFGHLISEVKTLAYFNTVGEGNCEIQSRQLFGIEVPSSVELTGWRKYINSYTLQGRRNCVLATYGILAVTAAAYLMHRQNKKENQTTTA